ncbi:MAG: NAD(P)H-hydrate epimerase [Candidatus Omnitrophica bacterium]|nr:NAD(P)H-hydrate epimerase [Candidatus Omnitrophota bacterium]
MQRLDETAIHAIGIPRLLLMHQAGLAVAHTAQRFLEPAAPLLVCCGTGYNGGDGLCAAWQLARWGYRPRVLLLGTASRLKDEPAVYARLVRACDVPLHECTAPEHLRDADRWMRESRAIIDALLGIGVAGPVRPLYAELIRRINTSGTPVVSADIPSGLDGDTGHPHGTAVTATVTVTFGWPKHGLFLAEGPAHAGEVLTDDLGMPPNLLNAP